MDVGFGGGEQEPSNKANRSAKNLVDIT